jgi:hypothetical protein
MKKKTKAKTCRKQLNKPNSWETTNHISSRNNKSNPYVDHQPLENTRYPNPRMNRLQRTCRIQADSFIQISKTPDESKHDIAEIVSRECGQELKVGLAPYEVSGVDPKGNVEAVRQEV